jgi:hypothetical protein
MRRIHTMQTHPDRLVTHIERHAFAADFGELAHQRNEDIAEIQTALIQRAEHEGGRAKLIAAVVKTQQQAVLDQRARQAKQRAFVEPGARRQLGECQRPVVRSERKQDRASTVDDGNAFALFRASFGLRRLHV